jgi:hypothetical protein
VNAAEGLRQLNRRDQLARRESRFDMWRTVAEGQLFANIRTSLVMRRNSFGSARWVSRFR